MNLVSLNHLTRRYQFSSNLVPLRVEPAYQRNYSAPNRSGFYFLVCNSAMNENKPTKSSQDDARTFNIIGIVFLISGAIFLLIESTRMIGIPLLTLGATFLLISWDSTKNKRKKITIYRRTDASAFFSQSSDESRFKLEAGVWFSCGLISVPAAGRHLE